MSVLVAEPVNEVKTALYAALAADGTLAGLLTANPDSGSTNPGIYEDGKQASKPLPLVTYMRQGGGAGYVLGGVKHWRYLFAVKGIAESSKTAGAVAARLSAVLLDDDPLAFAGDVFEVFEVHHMGLIDYPELSDGKAYSHVGATWDIYVREAS